jgi:periplasmic divalent cation tolerance protein
VNRVQKEVFVNIIQIVTTVGSKEEAENIGRHLVERRLASCAQILGPIKSIYRWKGRIEDAEEWQCIIKSRESHYKKIEQEIIKLHSYELPEITGLEFDHALTEYADWIVKETDYEQP